METHLDVEMDRLRQRLLLMASHAEMAVAQASQALTQRDEELAMRVWENDRIIDHLEVDTDEMIIQQLTKAPLATDLRLVTVAIKISKNLERIGDEATKIAKRAIDLCREAPVKIKLDLPQMTRLTLGMLKASLDAFGNQNPAAARAVIPDDRKVDLLNKKIHQALALQMAKHPDTINRCLHLMVVSKSLERIADHATNIAEDVVYLCEARDIRHTGAKWPEAT